LEVEAVKLDDGWRRWKEMLINQADSSAQVPKVPAF
jgi:hypothetical protein